MLALSIRQPYAELILRGVKTVEYRTVRTHKIGERFYIYVPRKWAAGNWEPAIGERGIGNREPAAGSLATGSGQPAAGGESDCRLPDPGCLLHRLPDPDCHLSRLPIPACQLPTSVIVGSAVIRSCRLSAVGDRHDDDFNSGRELMAESGKPIYEWHLTNVKRYKRPRKVHPDCQPQPVWFQPFANAA